jgi:hypothetical protein
MIGYAPFYTIHRRLTIGFLPGYILVGGRIYSNIMLRDGRFPFETFGYQYLIDPGIVQTIGAENKLYK